MMDCFNKIKKFFTATPVAEAIPFAHKGECEEYIAKLQDQQYNYMDNISTNNINDKSRNHMMKEINTLQKEIFSATQILMHLPEEPLPIFSTIEDCDDYIDFLKSERKNHKMSQKTFYEKYRYQNLCKKIERLKTQKYDEEVCIVVDKS